MNAWDDARIEARLRGLAIDATWPTTPDLRAAVVARIQGDAPLGHRPPPGVIVPRRLWSRRFAGALALALVVLLALAGIAAALGYRLPGLDILFVDQLPPAGTGLDLGTAEPLDVALGLEQPQVLVPALLPRPVTAWALGTGSSQIVTLAYRARDGQPALDGSDLALTIMAVPGDTDEVFLSKILGPGTTISPVTVGGSPGWWIAGAPHEILIRRPDSMAGVLRSALAGDSLVFSRDGTLYRLESALGRDATITIAESMR
jgi:hypothetical protein